METVTATALYLLTLTCPGLTGPALLDECPGDRASCERFVGRVEEKLTEINPAVAAECKVSVVQAGEKNCITFDGDCNLIPSVCMGPMKHLECFEGAHK